MIAVSSGEIQNPRRTIPRLARLIFYRLVGFYVIGVFFVGIICSSEDAGLISAISGGGSGAASSPWVIGIQNLAISGLPGFINFLILLSGWSCGNAYLYATSRSLYSMARDKQAPKIFAKCTKSGVPIYAVLTVSLFSCLTYLVASNSALEVFYWFVSLTTIAYLLVYTGMLWTFLGWYYATKAQGLDRNTLPYKAPFAPYSAYLAIAIGCLVMFFIGFDCFVPFSVQGFITSYFGAVFAAAAFIFWKLFKGTKFTKAAERDLYSGKAEIDEECRHWEEGGMENVQREKLANMGIVQRTWERMW
jgi:amino acid transporter